MRPLVLVLSISTAGFAGSTVYFANKLHDARSRAPLEQPLTAEAASTQLTRPSDTRSGGTGPGDQGHLREAAGDLHSPASTSSQENGAGSSVPSGVSAQPAAPATAAHDEEWREVQRRTSAAYIRNYEDPARRSVMLEDRKAMVRRFTRGLADVANLSDEEMDRLVDLMAEQGLERTLWDHRCRVDPSCDEAKHTFPNAEQHAAEIAALLGPEKYQSYRQFRLAGTERGIVEQLRLRLVDRDPLGNKAAQQLISALWEERERYFAQAEQRGVRLGMSWTSDSIVVTRAVEQGPGYALDQHALEFNELTRARASAILTPEQLRVFTEMQDEGYRQLESLFRRQAAVKVPAGPAR